MSALTYTRQLIEHRYGRSLTDLQHTAHYTGDPVLPVVLRRLRALADTHDKTRVAQRRLDAAWRRRSDGGHGLGELVVSANDLMELETRQHQEAEVIWDLLDVRLLLDQPRATPVPGRPASRGEEAVTEPAMATARQVAAGLDRLNRETLRQGLHEHGIHLSNHRLGAILRRLRAEPASF